MDAISLYVVILAGGKGERFWPLSTPEEPKPFLHFFSERSLLQQTFDRACSLVPGDQIFVVVGQQHEPITRRQLPDLADSRLLLEASGRDTAAAIGYASLHLPRQALMLVLPADHMIPDSDAFAETVRHAAALVAQQGGPCTFGIVPDRPEVNYGYIHAKEENLGSKEFSIHPVEEFIEKPDRARAEKFLLHGSYYWNSGIFLWRVSRIQELLHLHLPELWEGLLAIQSEADPRLKDQKYSALPRISIDYGVMQKADGVLVVPARFRWDDIGTWTSLVRILTPDGDGNLVWGKHSGIETSNCILYGESHTMVTAGVRDLIIVQRGGNLLICHKHYADRLKELLAKRTS